MGKGVSNAVGFVNTEIADALDGFDALDQRVIDQVMLDLDGTAAGYTIAIDVVFAGRRTKQADLLLKKLQFLWTQANRKTAPGDEPPEVDTVRLPVRVEGSWRPRFERDDQGWETRTHQLFAARWVLNHDGESKTFGEPPVKVRAPM